MPFFGSNSSDEQHLKRDANEKNGTTRRTTLFSRGSSSSASSAGNTTSPNRGGFFRRSPSYDEAARLAKDPSISAARHKLTDAEAAEREAGKALQAARMKVKEARDHAKILEREALEDSRRAKAKQAESKSLNKSVRGLGKYN